MFKILAYEKKGKVVENRVKWIDAVKGIAITGVVLVHSGFSPSLSPVLGKVVSAGDKGVQAFFIISAYLLYISYEKHKAKSGSYFAWLKGKWLRLAPYFYLAMVISLISLGGFLSWTGDVGRITIGNVLAHFFFLHGLHPVYANSILGVEWYLADYAILIAIIPVIHKLVNSFSKALAFFAGSAVICYFITYAASMFPLISDAKLWGTYVESFWFPTQFPVMVAGVLLYFIIGKMRNMNIASGNKLLSYTILAGSVYLLVMLIAGMSLKGVSIYIPYSLAILGVIVSQLLYKCPLLVNGFWCVLGKNSYIIYLFHRILFSLYEKIFKKYYDFSMRAWLTKFVVVFSMSVLLAFGINLITKRVKNKMNSSKEQL